MLNAATRMISVRIRNITFRSTSTAAKKLLLLCVQSITRTGSPASSPRSARLTRCTWSGSAVITSIWVAAFGWRKNTCAASIGRNTKPVSASLKPTWKIATTL